MLVRLIARKIEAGSLLRFAAIKCLKRIKDLTKLGFISTETIEREIRHIG